jgi:hypothetical protein
VSLGAAAQVKCSGAGAVFAGTHGCHAHVSTTPRDIVLSDTNSWPYSVEKNGQAPENFSFVGVLGQRITHGSSDGINRFTPDISD